jgi:hypothetical protein
MDKELLVYAVLRKIADNLPDNDIYKMLRKVTLTVDGIKRTHSTTKSSTTFARRLSNARTSRQCSPTWTKTTPAIDSSTIFWLIGPTLRGHDGPQRTRPRTSHPNPIMLYLAAQSDNFYRIEDDRMRLLVTYTYTPDHSKYFFRRRKQLAHVSCATGRRE